MGANADTVREAWEAFGRGDIDGATSTTDDSAEIVVPETLPWGGTYRGPDGFKEMIGKFMGELEEFNAQPQTFLEADDDHVVVPVGGSARTKSGNELAIRALWLYQVRGGKLVRADFYGDTAATLDALG
jgi:ketosteroid isomerase-like protein